MSRTLKITLTESVTVQESKPELLEVEAVYAPAGKEPPKHYHPSQDEHFEVLEGSIRVRAGDEERTLGVGGRPLAFAALLTEYDDVFRLAVGPEPLVHGALAALAPLGRMRGYRAPPA